MAGLTVRGLQALASGKWLSERGDRGAGVLRAKGASQGARFYFRYRNSDGRYDDLPLGVFDEKGRDGLTLVQAKVRAGEMSKRYQAGERDLREILGGEQREAVKKRKAAEKAELAARVRVDASLEKLLRAYADHLLASGKPSHKQVARAIARNIIEPFPKMAALPADGVTVDDVMPAFHALAKAGKLREAEKLRAYLRAAYTAARKARTDATMHAFAGFAIRVNPLAELDVSRPKEAADQAVDKAQGRVWALTEAQLAVYWKRISNDNTPKGVLLQFHLLTGGQRVEQLARLSINDFDSDLNTIRILDTKGRRQRAREHVIPLIPEALNAMQRMRGEKPTGGFLFTLNGGESAAGYHVVWEAVHAASQAMVDAGEVPRLFTPGTIRKTVETRLAAKGVADEVLSRLLSHGLGGVQARNYNAHHYDDEKRSALSKLLAMCQPKAEA